MILASKKDASQRLAIVMIARDEGHNMRDVLENISDLADEIFLVDSFSVDDTVDIAQEYNVHVVQRKFRGFGEQWNFALTLPITAPWTMKLDPDERLSDELKISIRNALAEGKNDGYMISRKLWFMGKPIHVCQDVLRIWRTGKCRFSNVLVNEHPIIDGSIGKLIGVMEHHDSPTLHHWINKQNNYTTADAQSMYQREQLAAKPIFFGNALQRRMFYKSIYSHVPFRHHLMYFYCLILMGAWRAGKPGFIWSRLRMQVYQMREDKLTEMRLMGKSYSVRQESIGAKRCDVDQAE